MKIYYDYMNDNWDFFVEIGRLCAKHNDGIYYTTMTEIAEKLNTLGIRAISIMPENSGLEIPEEDLTILRLRYGI